MENSCPGTQGPGEMHPQNKNFKALHVIGSHEWREHTHVQKLSFINTDYRKKIKARPTYILKK